MKRLISELRARPLAYLLLAAFLVMGPLAAWFLFPEAPAGARVIGGLALGGYAALCTVPQKFL